jgi:hypothetical protein
LIGGTRRLYIFALLHSIFSARTPNGHLGWHNVQGQNSVLDSRQLKDGLLPAVFRILNPENDSFICLHISSPQRVHNFDLFGRVADDPVKPRDPERWVASWELSGLKRLIETEWRRRTVATTRLMLERFGALLGREVEMFAWAVRQRARGRAARDGGVWDWINEAYHEGTARLAAGDESGGETAVVAVPQE